MNVAARTIRLALALPILASPLSAQSISFGLRGTGSFPTGDFAADPSSTNTAVIQGAKQGFGYGAEVAVSVGPLGAYGSFDHIAFDCETTACSSKGEYTLQGVTVGLRLMSPAATRFRPFLKGGATFNELKGGYGSASNVFDADIAPGYEIGAGADLAVLRLVSIQPQLRYVGQRIKATSINASNTYTTTMQWGANYFTLDLGLALHLPFGM